MNTPARQPGTTLRFLCFSVVVLGAIMLGMSGPALSLDNKDAPASRQDLQRIEREIDTQKEHRDALADKRQSASKEAASLRAELVQTARHVQNLEGVISDLDERLRALEEQATQMLDRLNARQRQISVFMAVLQRIALRPPALSYLSVQDTADTANAATLMARVIPVLREEARKLKVELESLKALRARLQHERSSRARAMNDLGQKRSRLDALVRDKKMLSGRLSKSREATDKRIAELSARAKTLRELIAALAEKPGPRPLRRSPETARAAAYVTEPDLARLNTLTFSQAKGLLLPPAQGKIAVRYGDSIGPATTSKGLTIRTGDTARIVAPFAGNVVYSGKFRGYRHLLIISHGEGYHGLIAGLDRVDVKVGQNLLAGEPVGVMGRSQDGSNDLYFEIRRSGKSLNPLPWLVSLRKADAG